MSIRMTVIFLSLLQISTISESCFRAGVYEHIQINRENDKVKDGDVHYYLRKNLDVYKQVVERAQKEKVRVIVLPEGGLFSVKSRSEAKELSENIPIIDSKNPLIPCDDKRFKDLDKSPGILKFLSCLAKDSHMYLIADLADLQPCDVSSPDCPKDGHRIFNTAVAFDPKGLLIQKYHKRHLFGEYNYDVPNEQQLATFNTAWGSMGLMICFDIIYRDPGLALIKEKNVTTLLLPTAWFDEFPFLMSSQYHNAWAMGNQVNILAANMKNRMQRAIGSGIYSGNHGAIVYKHDVDEDGMPSLLISDIPIDPANGLCNPKSKIVKIDYGMRDKGEYPILQVPLNSYHYRNLTGSDFNGKVCNGTFCCFLDGKLAEESKSTLVFGLTNKVRVSTTVTDYSWCEQACFLMTVDSTGKYSWDSSSIFKDLKIFANFTTNSVYPSVLTQKAKLLSTTEWNMKKVGETTELTVKNKVPITMVGLFGRCYDRDPPYYRSHKN